MAWWCGEWPEVIKWRFWGCLGEERMEMVGEAVRMVVRNEKGRGKMT
jgi:hypothetical protein